MTATIQPPLLAWAWRIAVGDPAEQPALVAHHDWICEHRDLDGDGLIWIVQPDESGLDSSPQFDGIWGAARQDRSSSSGSCAATAGSALTCVGSSRAAGPRAARS